MAKPKAAPGFQPHALRDPAGVLGGRFGRLLVLAPTFCGVRVVERVCNIETQLGVRDRLIMDWHLPNYPVLAPDEFPLQSLILELKEEMLLHGATPEAVQLVGAVAPFNEKELQIMADKLKTKTAAKKPAAKADTKAKIAPKKNADATKAARAVSDGKRAELYAKKIKVLNKSHGAREGSNRANMLNVVLASKTVQEAVDGGATMVDVRFAEAQGFISLS